jgi:uncharacterized protein YdhG (YjbR/CyaY superfamily)
MQSSAKNIETYMAELPADRKEVITRLYTVIRENLPEGFSEGIGYGMIGWVVPHTLFPACYHCDPKQPVPFINLASQKNHIGLYHMGMYGSSALLNWFVEEWHKHSKKKLDMGKACVRFKNTEDIPYELIAELCKKLTPKQWLDVYLTQLELAKKR